MTWEIIAKAAGSGMTAQLTIGPYANEPPEGLVKAVHAAFTNRFEEWTGSQPETVVVTSQPLPERGAGVRPSG